MQVTTIGLDLAKNVFQVHGVTEGGTVGFNRSLRRGQVHRFFETLPPCLVGIEACGTSHYWAREIAQLGHEVRLIPPAYVKPYVKRGKSDAIDAEAICEAVTRPSMRFVAVKSPEQQAVLALHRVRDLIVRQRTQIVNMLRGVLAEFGIVVRQGAGHAIAFARQCLEGVEQDLPDLARDVVTMMVSMNSPSGESSTLKFRHSRTAPRASISRRSLMWNSTSRVVGGAFSALR